MFSAEAVSGPRYPEAVGKGREAHQKGVASLRAGGAARGSADFCLELCNALVICVFCEICGSNAFFLGVRRLPRCTIFCG